MIYKSKLKMYEILYLILIIVLPISSRLNISNSISVTFIIVGMLVYLFIIETMIYKNYRIRLDKSIIFLVYIFLGLNLISYIFCESKLEFISSVKNFIIPILIGFFTIIFLDSRNKLNILIKALVYSGVIVSVLNSLQMIVIFNTLGYKGIGPLGNPNYFAGILTCILPLAIYNSRNNKLFINKIIVYIYIGGIIISFSKTAWVGMIISIFILFFKDLKKSITTVPIITLFIYIFWNIMIDKFDLSNIIQNTINGFGGGTRQILFKVAIVMSTSSIVNLIFGVGLGNFPINTYKFKYLYTSYHTGSESHNILTDILTENGILGISIFLFLVYRMFKSVKTLKKYNMEEYIYLYLMLIQIILYTITHGAGRTFFYMWIFIGISSRLGVVNGERKNESIKEII